jgi:hypothetical protein
MDVVATKRLTLIGFMLYPEPVERFNKTDYLNCYCLAPSIVPFSASGERETRDRGRWKLKNNNERLFLA